MYVTALLSSNHTSPTCCCLHLATSIVPWVGLLCLFSAANYLFHSVEAFA